MDALLWFCMLPPLLPMKDDLPPANDLKTFIPPWVKPKDFKDWTTKQWRESCRFTGWCKKQYAAAPLHQQEGWTAAIREGDRLKYIWDALDYAACTEATTDARRYWLGELRRMIGQANYPHGWLGIPPPVPEWMFPERD